MWRKNRKDRNDIPVVEKSITPAKWENVLIYTRVSSAKQLTEWSGLKWQETACMEWCQKHEINVIKVFSDGWISGKYTSREGLDSMIEYLKKENRNYTKIPFVIIDDIDRIVRDVQGRWEIKAKIEKLWWAKLFSLKQKIEDTPEGKMLQSITMSVKQYERENNGRRTKDRQRQRLLWGYWCWSPMQGYEFEKDPKGWRILKLVPNDAQIIKEGLELFADWVLLNPVRLKDFYNERGLISRQGNKICKSFVELLLKKDSLLFYAWYIDFPSWDVHMAKAMHPPIISLSTVAKITERLTTKTQYKTYTESDIARELPLRWSLCCEHCKHPMTGAPTKNRWGTHYFYYSCRQKGCENNGKSFWNKQVHLALVEHLKSLSIDPWTLTLFEKALRRFWTEKDRLKIDLTQSDKQEFQEIQNKVRFLQERIMGTTNEKLITLYETQMINLLEEGETLKNKLSKDEVYTDIDIEMLIQENKTILENPVFIWELENLELKRLLTGVLFNGQIYYNKESGIQTPSIPLIYANFSSVFTIKYFKSGPEGVEPSTRSFGDSRSTAELRP